MPPFHGGSGTAYNKNQSNSETASFHHGHSSLTLNTNNLASNLLHQVYCMSTIISSGHNYVWHYFVSLSIEMECTFMMCSMFKTYIRQYCTQSYLVLDCCRSRAWRFWHSTQYCIVGVECECWIAMVKGGCFWVLMIFTVRCTTPVSVKRWHGRQ
jgi:hypothetical protein